ncbi:hypothetical protein L248_3056 [Schleiferilactobacillus shenzhenensis LY-73]|uniref:Holin n=1 Tax=Schleiferilactobacillus shenzhenensis LY-73 TaxID=1231336 RepID=U4TTA8_9LACO|nr:hypothetical protein L248_3056 [Schleiferilactobacillus shenzhenensis LY-73]
MRITDVLTVVFAFGSFVLLLVDVVVKLVVVIVDNRKNDR